MADSVVTSFMENLGRLVSTQEGNNWHLEVNDQVKKLEEELKFIDDFLKASENKRDENDEVEDSVDQITEAVLGAEDVLENYMAKLLKHSKWNLMVKVRDSSGLIKVLQDVTKKIRNVKNLINDIYGNTNKYGIVKAEEKAEDEEHSLHQRRRNGDNDDDDGVALSFKHDTTSTVKLLFEEERDGGDYDNDDDDDVVGFVRDITTLVKQLTQRDHDHRFVISITGMSGLGKTTLARKIYNDNRVKDHFDCRAWVYVSQDFKTNEYLLLGILRRLKPTSEEMYKDSTYQELKDELHNSLNSKKYLIVLDNVWTTDVIHEVREALPNSHGSRILITTRLADVQARRKSSSTSNSTDEEGGLQKSSPTNNIFLYRLPVLDKNESWQLFCKKVFGEKECPPQLETIGRQLAESCKGLPISILVLGGLLYHMEESTHVSWSKLTGSTVNLNYDEKTRCLDILTLSYNHLPRHLKSCFLYFGVFPVDFVFSARKLINLWLAEGLILTTKSTAEHAVDVAEEYLEELVDRSLVQVTSRRTDGGVKTCRIHEIVQDLSVFESTREEFLEVHSKANPSSMIDYVRRLSIQGNITESIPSYSSDSSCARSLFVFGEGNNFDSKHWRWIYKNMKLIRVLCLDKVNLNSIPNNIEKLLFLRYLRIWSEKVLEIPEFPAAICNLQFLETIDVKGRVKDCLPKGLLSMKRLRHLNFSGGMSLFPDKSSDTSVISNLQVLSYVLVGKFSDLNNLLKFPKVRKLHLRCTNNNDNDKKDSDEVAKVLESLQSLKVVDFRKSVPSSILLPSTLVKITFKSSYLDSTHFGILGKLPKLQFLKLEGIEFSTSTLSCNVGEFPNLRVFQMIDLKIKIWELKSNAMPELRRLVIVNCNELTNLPKGLSSLKALQIVQVSPKSERFTDVLQELEFRDSFSEVY